MTATLLHTNQSDASEIAPECGWRAFQSWEGPNGSARREWTDNEQQLFKLIEKYRDDHNVGYTPLRFSWPADKCKSKVIPVAWSDEWILDIDHDNDLNIALEVTRLVHTHLVQEWGIPKSEISVWFSGRKGFHVVVPVNIFPELSPDPYLHEILEELRLELVDELSLRKGAIDTCFDKANQIVRAPNTRHQKSGLWKVCLPPEVLDEGVESILKFASEEPR